MNNLKTVFNSIIGGKILPLYFHPSAEVSRNILKALYNAGIRNVEYTNRGENALENFKELKRFRDEQLQGLFLGIGTIKTAAQADLFIEAGADFIISPGIVPEILNGSYSDHIVYIPGCMTPSEIMQAESAGTTLVKIFPGNVLGPAYLNAVKELFPKMLFMPTGGVDTTKENLTAWFKAGAAAVGMGSKLLPAQVVEEENYAEITSSTQTLLKIIKEIRP